MILLYRIFSLLKNWLTGEPYLSWGSCRFRPTCSQYCRQALRRYWLKGLWLCWRRLMRCHPGHPGGWDPLP